jgi:Uma2 family endonuclease
MYQTNSSELVQKPLPTMYDLPSEDPQEPGLPDEFHVFQPQLLRETCQVKTYAADDIFIGTDINLYYDSRHTLWQKRPHWFLVLGVPSAKRQEDLRWSYVVWQEGVSPFLVVELLSPGTEDEDLGRSLR